MLVRPRIAAFAPTVLVLAVLVLALLGCSSDGASPGADAGLGADTARGSDTRRADGNTGDARGDTRDARDADGSNGDAADPCAPRPATSTRGRFTTLLADVAAAPNAAARQAHVDAFLAGLGDDYPLRDAAGAVIVAEQASLRVAGSFNNWTPTQTLARLADTSLYSAELAIGADEASYKLVDGNGQWTRDTRNRHVRWDGIPRAGVGSFNSLIPSFGLPKSGTSANKGRLEALRIKSPELANERDVFVYLPTGYDSERCSERALLVVNDGNESLTRSHFDDVADVTISTKRSASLVIAFVALANQNDRLAEYGSAQTSKGPQYADFLCDTLIPALEKRYRLRHDKRQRAVIGASLGGLSALATLFWRSDCFARAGAQSGSFWYEDEALIKRVNSGAKIAVEATYLDNGTDNRDSTLKMRDTLAARGYPVVHGENLSQGHTWDAWADRFDEALGALFAAGGSP